MKNQAFCRVVFIHLILFVTLASCSNESEPVNTTRKLLGSGYGLSSITLLVQNIDSANKYYSEALGFNLPDLDDTEKGIYEGSLLSSVRFPDGFSFELMTLEDSLVTDQTPPFITNFLKRYEGARLLTLSTSSVDSTYSWLKSRGFVTDSVRGFRTSDEIPTGWGWDDGGLEERSIDFNWDAPPAYLPRYVEYPGEDYNRANKMRTTYYAYYRSFSNHPNGAVGVSAIRIAVDDLAAARDEFTRMGLQEVDSLGTETTAHFQVLRQQKIVLTSSITPKDEIDQFLTERGPGIYAVQLEVNNLDSTYHYFTENLPAEALHFDSTTERIVVDREYAYGLQLEFVREPEEQALMAAKLKIGGTLDTVAQKHAAAMYQKYCALCHGENREGYAADNAPSLRSHSLLATSKNNNFARYTIQYGRAGTAMAGYLDLQGGPMQYIEIELLLQWLYETAEVEEAVNLSRDPIKGNIEKGAELYASTCAVCHGESGEGISAPALGNPMLLATATDEFLKYAIMEGREGTPMIAFKDSLSEDQINDVTAFLRSRASGWDIPEGDTVTVPKPEDYVLNPDRAVPDFDLRQELFVSAAQVNQAMQDSMRMVILDARSEVAWRQTHIPGSIPVPYYDEPDSLVNYIPNDSTWVVVYCACPHAASQRVVNTLKRYGYKKLAIIDEGVLVWAQLGYPVKHGN